MRPRGDARLALRRALEAAGAQALTWKDAAAAARLGREQARRTLCNMARAGEAERVRQAAAGGFGRPMVAFKLAPEAPQARGVADALAALDAVTRCAWSGRPRG